jgi:hypothetical protein
MLTQYKDESKREEVKCEEKKKMNNKKKRKGKE